MAKFTDEPYSKIQIRQNSSSSNSSSSSSRIHTSPIPPPSPSSAPPPSPSPSSSSSSSAAAAAMSSSSSSTGGQISTSKPSRLFNLSYCYLSFSVFLLLCWFLIDLGSCQLRVLGPVELVVQVQLQSPDGSEIVPGATATFGAPSYGESFIGQVFTAASNTTFCTDDYKDEITAAVNASKSAVSPNFTITPDRSAGSPPQSTKFLRSIFMLDRGVCTFSKKAGVAQTLGADAVIFVDSASSAWTRKDMVEVIVADDGYGWKVQIPSVLISKEDGRILRQFVGNGTAPSVSPVLVQLQWSLPQRRSVVFMEFWTEAGSAAGQRFLSDFAYHASMLKGHLQFTPHYNIYGFQSALAANFKLCLQDDLTLCSNPPDSLVSTQITGSDVLEEDMRQLCLWRTTAGEQEQEHASETGLYRPAWWEYLRKFSIMCPVIPPPSKLRFSTECSFDVMKSIPGINVEEVKKCVKERGRDLLQSEKENRAWGLLAVRINGARFSGVLDASQVSKAICSAFEQRPPECDTLAGAVLVEPSVTHSKTVSAKSLLFASIFAVSLIIVALYFYQRHVRSSMRHALRHEVMLEVRSQLQDYHKMEEDGGSIGVSSPASHRMPLMISS